ncbi:MAG: hypothetical protein ISN28_09320 [Ectothiorhodospiraceae bacterium AqS1]|nr:hypothetical protein [Ectothiorhodospiraceae bacterium AqS1]
MSERGLGRYHQARRGNEERRQNAPCRRHDQPGPEDGRRFGKKRFDEHVALLEKLNAGRNLPVCCVELHSIHGNGARLLDMVPPSAGFRPGEITEKDISPSIPRPRHIAEKGIYPSIADHTRKSADEKIHPLDFCSIPPFGTR